MNNNKDVRNLMDMSVDSLNVTLDRQASAESNEETSTTSELVVVDNNNHQDQQQQQRDTISTITTTTEDFVAREEDRQEQREVDARHQVEDQPTSSKRSSVATASFEDKEVATRVGLEKVEVSLAGSSSQVVDNEATVPVDTEVRVDDEIKKSPSQEELKFAKTLVEDTIEQVISSNKELEREVEVTVKVEEESPQRKQPQRESEQNQRVESSNELIREQHLEPVDCVERSFQTASGDASQFNILDQTTPNRSNIGTMEFTKNYSDDLLMGQEGGASGGVASGPSGDLADFELPQFSSSSSGSEGKTQQQQQQQQTPSPTKRKSSSSSAANTSQASSSQVCAAAPDLTAVKNLLISSYSKVSHVFHWTKPIETGVIFAIGSILIIALTFFSIISVVAYTALGIILSSGLIRIYKMAMKTLNRSQETPFDHIWDKVLSLDVSMSPEKLHRIVDSSHSNINASLVYFKQVLLVQDKFSTLKFASFLYMLTYIGAWFNGLTIITISYLALFTVPIFYDKNKTKIDEYINLATSQVCSVTSLVSSKVGALVGGGSSDASKKQK